MIKSISLAKRQISILLVFSLLISIAGIIHGIFFDLAWEQVKRLTFGGLIFTFIVVFPGVLFLEWVFDINNKVEMGKLERRIRKLERRKK